MAQTGTQVTQGIATYKYQFTNPQDKDKKVVIFNDDQGAKKILVAAWHPTGYLVDGLSGELSPATSMSTLNTNKTVIKNYYEHVKGQGTWNDNASMSSNISSLANKIKDKVKAETSTPTLTQTIIFDDGDGTGPQGPTNPQDPTTTITVTQSNPSVTNINIQTTSSPK